MENWKKGLWFTLGVITSIGLISVKNYHTDQMEIYYQQGRLDGCIECMEYVLPEAPEESPALENDTIWTVYNMSYEY